MADTEKSSGCAAFGCGGCLGALAVILVIFFLLVGLLAAVTRAMGG
jgi:hypothetical protein